MNTPPNTGSLRTPPSAGLLPPPAPAVSATLLALSSTLRWVPRYNASGTAPALGTFRSHSTSGEWTLALIADDRAVDGIGNRCAWALDGDRDVDPACLRFLVSRETAHVLQEGELHETGAITWQKRHYRIEARRGFNGIGRPELIAEAVPW